MQRASLAFLLTIAVLIGFTTRSLVERPLRSLDAPVIAASSETGTAFYTALNDALGGESLQPLAAMLSGVFVDHDADSGETRSADAFLAAIRAHGVHAQRIRLEPTFIETITSGQLIVGIRPVQDGEIAIAGMTFEQSVSQPHLEVLRVERGKIVDRWAPEFSALEVTELVDELPAFSSTIGFTTSLMRIELTGSDERTWQSPERAILMAEHGTLALNILVDGRSASTVMLENGEFVAIPDRSRVRLRISVGSTASVVIYQATRLAAVDTGQSGLAASGSAQGGVSSVMWSGSRYWAASDTLHRPARIVLPAHGEIRLTRPAGSVLLVGANAAGIDIEAPGGDVTVLGKDRWPMVVDGPVALDATRAGWIQNDGAVLLRNETDRPITLMLVSIEPGPASGEPRGSCPVPCPPPPMGFPGL